MRELRSFKSAATLGSLTAAVALLAGLSSAGAQAPAPGAPLAGAGSFPGSFIVPGTQTSLHVGGVVQADYYYDMSTRDGADSASVTGVPVEGTGVATGAQQGLHGNLRFRVNSSRFNTETRTPTEWGEVKTFWEIDFQGSEQLNTANAGTATLATGGATGATPCCVNGEIPRLRQSYGTLGPVLIGQTQSLFTDGDAWPDFLDGGDPALDGVGTNRAPQIRYTYLLPMGISTAVSAEMPISGGVIASNPAGFNTAATFFTWNSFSSPTWIPQHVPAFVSRTRIDQPWGHASFQVAIQQARFENDVGAAAIFPTPQNPLAAVNGVDSHLSKWGYQLAASGHLNTWGRDRATLYIAYGQGASNYNSDVFFGGSGAYYDGLVCSVTDGAGNFQCSQPRNWGIDTSYDHWWTDTLRSNVAFGFAQVSKPNAAGTWCTAPNGTAQCAGTTLTNSGLAFLEDRDLTAHINLQWSPTGNTNFGIEYQFYHRVVQSGAFGSHHRIETQAQFKF